MCASPLQQLTMSVLHFLGHFCPRRTSPPSLNYLCIIIIIIIIPRLTGKTKDSNSNFLAKTLFDLAIDLKRIEVIADDEDEITEAVRRLSSNYDLVITSGESAEPLRVAELMLFDFRRNRTNT